MQIVAYAVEAGVMVQLGVSDSSQRACGMQIGAYAVGTSVFGFIICLAAACRRPASYPGGRVVARGHVAMQDDQDIAGLWPYAAGVLRMRAKYAWLLLGDGWLVTKGGSRLMAFCFPGISGRPAPLDRTTQTRRRSPRVNPFIAALRASRHRPSPGMQQGNCLDLGWTKPLRCLLGPGGKCSEC